MGTGTGGFYNERSYAVSAVAATAHEHRRGSVFKERGQLEIACYKNKVISYRSGTESRLDEVLQVERIFANVARGYLASEKEIQTVFGSEMTEAEAIKYMLDQVNCR
ncbi:Shwachman-Bodian-Diamond syndrome (SBDS) family protein [Leishmania donovani]|uniref:Shwachman-Bodian-Diamond syndrome (SBDS) family protein n=1 Tax=Leishmania donovani TaxID=5661 RepID=A0A504XN67_LEIDO|nr:Shwachman-Bodian-Diamond syndrome (SBDS) family protein [Leishmania donovani]